MDPLFQSPLVLAKRMATLDRLSGGRLMAGIGQGWMPEEFEAVGVPMTRRGAGFEEHIAAMRACWRPDPVEHLGRWYSIPRSTDRTEAREGRGSAARRWHDQARGRARGPAGRRLRGGDDGLGHVARPGGVVPRRRRRGTGRPARQPRDGRCRRTARAVHRADPVGGRRSRPRPALPGVDVVVWDLNMADLDAHRQIALLEALASALDARSASSGSALGGWEARSVEPVITEVQVPPWRLGPYPATFEAPQFRRRRRGRHRPCRHRYGAAVKRSGAPLQPWVRGTDVTDIVLTHSHFDHTGGLAESAELASQHIGLGRELR